MGRHGRAVTWLVAFVLALGALACSTPEPPPDVTVLQWMQAFAAQDGTTVARLTCRGSQSDVQNTRLLSMALGVAPPTFGGAGGGQFYGGGGGQPVYDVSQLRYETTFADAVSARVQVTGYLRLISGLATQVLSMNSAIGLVREQQVWHVCDDPGAST